MAASSDIQITLASSAQDIAAVKTLFLDYLKFVETYLGQDLSFQGTQKEFADFPQTYDGLCLARLNGAPAAACGIKPLKPGICELKRLYCIPSARGHGLGLKVSRAAMRFAKDFGYTEIYLDTDHGLTHANKIYETLGFKDIDQYYDTPIESRFMACSLLKEF